MKVVTRYAPSPTGPQHIGGVRTALYAYLFAKKHGGEFILRIEDTDRTRFVPGAEEFIIEAMNWVGIDFTQGVHIGGPHAPYRQSERQEMYEQYAWQLVEEGKAYLAFDSSEEIEEMKEKMQAGGVHSPRYDFTTRSSMKNSLTLSEAEVQKLRDEGLPFVIRFMVPAKTEIRFHDLVRDWVHIQSNHVDDKVLLKSDGMPTYHLANVVDDHMMEVTHVIRGEEWLSSTPLHVLMYQAFGWEPPKFAHLSLLLNPNGSKMSKRNAEKFGIPIVPIKWQNPEKDEDWEGFRELGFLPEAFINYLALLGWHPEDEQEIMTLEEMVEKFSLDRVIKGGAKFDMPKLTYFNEVYLRQKSGEELLSLLKSIPEGQSLGTDDAKLLQIIELMRERISFIRDIPQQAGYFFSKPEEYDQKTLRKKWKEDSKAYLAEYVEILEKRETWGSENLETEFKSYLEAKEIGFGKIMPALRLALTGLGGGPHIFDIMDVLGKNESIERIKFALDELVPVN